MNSSRSIQPALLALAVFGGGVAATAGRGQSERPLQIMQVAETQFPATLAVQGISEGRVCAVIRVDPPDQLVDCLIVGYTHPEFARDLLQNLDSWRFVAPCLRGEPVSARAAIEFNYSARGVVLSISASDPMNPLIRRGIEPSITSLVCGAGELDRPLEPVQTVRPSYPGFMPPPGSPTGTATVDFYVDGEGRPRLAVVAKCSHEAFGAAAVDAIERWRFAPPTRRGQPVVVRAQQTFVFASRN